MSDEKHTDVKPGDHVATHQSSRLGTVAKVYPDGTASVVWDGGTPQPEGIGCDRVPLKFLRWVRPELAGEIAACKSLLGTHPEDALLPLGSAKSTLFQLEQIFHCISEMAGLPGAGHRIKHLADAGAYLAMDFGNFADCELESMMNRLRAAGAVPEGRCDD